MTRYRARWQLADTHPASTIPAWQLIVTLPNGDEKRGPVRYAATRPSRAEGERTRRRLIERGYWRIESDMKEAA